MEAALHFLQQQQLAGVAVPPVEIQILAVLVAVQAAAAVAVAVEPVHLAAQELLAKDFPVALALLRLHMAAVVVAALERLAEMDRQPMVAMAALVQHLQLLVLR